MLYAVRICANTAQQHAGWMHRAAEVTECYHQTVRVALARKAIFSPQIHDFSSSTASVRFRTSITCYELTLLCVGPAG